MSDHYLELVNSDFVKQSPLKKYLEALGLPQPVKLAREAAPVSPVAFISLDFQKKSTQGYKNVCRSWGVEIADEGTDHKVGGVIVNCCGVSTFDQLTELMAFLQPYIKKLKPRGRIIFIKDDVDASEDPGTLNSETLNTAVISQSLEALTASLAQEMRAGTTVNTIALAADVKFNAVSVHSALYYFLSGSSSFIDGQTITVTSNNGSGIVPEENPLDGQTAVVTGASGGIGSAIARTLHDLGAHVIVVDVPSTAFELNALANELGGLAVVSDITQDHAPQKIVQRIIQRYKRLDIIIHNAGITRDKLLVNSAMDQWQKVLDVNIAAQMKFNAYLQGQGYLQDISRIISISSISALSGNRGQTSYSASKAGILAVTDYYSQCVDSTKTTVNAVVPGFIETPMTAKMPRVPKEVARRMNALQQGGLPQDVASAVGFLACGSSGGITGQALRVCGHNIAGK